MEQEQTISLQELFQVLKKRLYLILIITILAVAASAAVSYFVMTPVYEVSTSLVVSKAGAGGSGNDLEAGYSASDIQTDLQLINTYNSMIKEPPVLEKVLKELDLDMTPGQLAGKINVQNKDKSMLVSLSVKDPDPKVAEKIANKTAEVLVEEVNSVMKTNNVSIYSPAKVSDSQSPVSPNPKLNIAIAAVIGLMIGVGLAFLLEYLDNTIKTEQDIENTLGMPVIGVIMDLNDFMKESEAKMAMKENYTGGEKIGS